MTADFLTDGPGDAAAVLLLAHGAGAPMDSPFMDAMANRFGARGIRILRFEFPYMLARRAGQRKPPPRADKLVGVYSGVLDLAMRETANARVFIGGKSLGGRVSAMLAGERDDIDGVVCLGYPFHPPGNPDALRLDPLNQAKVPVLVCQGDRDPFGRHEEVMGYPLEPHIRVEWFDDGDHDLKPRGRAAATWTSNLDAAAETAVAFMLEGYGT
ncbi:MAG: dienelactone hydrolase family protein [Rhodobiaceae bacterium]|nr:dienelactone hydrolase family protein [Rhodobiaceae bacterium]MCC0014216.1 dienelactone hydrolase family protein [Rhodobiaceae bacterium]MCC0017772.1 dienelactone hydrolase family protein [Rhodobiaceae bacterium]MCC0061937.1 dienelactone hydrolase family protein [Rhodobiaceae bacterium]